MSKGTQFITVDKTPEICKKIAQILEDDEHPLLKLKDIVFINGNGDELFITDYEFDLWSRDGYDEPHLMTSKSKAAAAISNFTILVSNDQHKRYWLDPMLNKAQQDPGYDDEDIVQIRYPAGFFDQISSELNPTLTTNATESTATKIRTIVDEDLSLQIGKVFTIVTVEIKENKIISTKVEHLEFNENTANDIVQMIKARG